MITVIMQRNISSSVDGSWLSDSLSAFIEISFS